MRKHFVIMEDFKKKFKKLSKEKKDKSLRQMKEQLKTNLPEKLYSHTKEYKELKALSLHYYISFYCEVN